MSALHDHPSVSNHINVFSVYLFICKCPCKNILFFCTSIFNSYKWYCVTQISWFLSLGTTLLRCMCVVLCAPNSGLVGFKEHRSWTEEVGKENSILEPLQWRKRILRTELGSSPNTTRTRRDSYPRSRVDSGMENPQEETSETRGFCSNWLDGILAEGRQGDKLLSVREDKFDQISKVGD